MQKRYEERVDVPATADYSLAERLDYERRILEFCVTAHLMEVFRGRFDSGELTPVSRAGGHAGRRVTVAGYPIATKGTTTSRNERMKFISLEDHTGVLEVVLFPDVYARFGRHLIESPLAVSGTVMEDETSLTLEADRVEPLR